MFDIIWLMKHKHNVWKMQEVINLQDLKRLRERKGLTQEQTSKILDITKEYLSMLERAERNPSDNLKEKMAKLYDCSITDIFLATKQTKCLSNK